MLLRIFAFHTDRRSPARALTIALIAAAVVITTACTPGGTTPTASASEPTMAVVEPTQAQPTAIPTATTAPTETTVPTVTAIPTATPEPTTTATATATLGPAAENNLSAWCLPVGVSTVFIEDPFTPYPDSRIGRAIEGAYEVRNLPASACTFIYQFNQPAPQGLTLAVYELEGKEPWLTAPLEVVEGQPQAVAATLTHSYIIAFPTWNTSYRFAVRDSAGQELRSDTVNLYRWTPELCWNGALPDINTLRCPLQQDLHPWDAGYGTPMPTAKPKE